MGNFLGPFRPGQALRKFLLWCTGTHSFARANNAKINLFMQSPTKELFVVKLSPCWNIGVKYIWDNSYVNCSSQMNYFISASVYSEKLTQQYSENLWPGSQFFTILLRMLFCGTCSLTVSLWMPFFLLSWSSGRKLSSHFNFFLSPWKQHSQGGRQ